MTWWLGFLRAFHLRHWGKGYRTYLKLLSTCLGKDEGPWDTGSLTRSSGAVILSVSIVSYPHVPPSWLSPTTELSSSLLQGTVVPEHVKWNQSWVNISNTCCFLKNHHSYTLVQLPSLSHGILKLQPIPTPCLYFLRQHTKWIKGKKVSEVKIISSLQDSLPLPPCLCYSDLFAWEEKKTPAPKTSGFSSGSIHSPPGGKDG